MIEILWSLGPTDTDIAIAFIFLLIYESIEKWVMNIGYDRILEVSGKKKQKMLL